MREVYRKLKAIAPDMIVEGEMQGDLALNEELRERYIPDSILKGEANLLVFPNLESANLSMTLLKEMTNALAVRADPDGTAFAGTHSCTLDDKPRHRQYGGNRGERSRVAGSRGLT